MLNSAFTSPWTKAFYMWSYCCMDNSPSTTAFAPIATSTNAAPTASTSDFCLLTKPLATCIVEWGVTQYPLQRCQGWDLQSLLKSVRSYCLILAPVKCCYWKWEATTTNKHWLTSKNVLNTSSVQLHHLQQWLKWFLHQCTAVLLCHFYGSYVQITSAFLRRNLAALKYVQRRAKKSSVADFISL